MRSSLELDELELEAARGQGQLLTTLGCQSEGKWFGLSSIRLLVGLMKWFFASRPGAAASLVWRG